MSKPSVHRERLVLKSEWDKIYPDWALNKIPKKVGYLLLRGAWLTGSQAEAWYKGLGPQTDVGKDWDLMVPFNYWRKCRQFIPLDAEPNGYRGWRFLDAWPDKELAPAQVDVWPDDLVDFSTQALDHRLQQYNPNRTTIFIVCPLRMIQMEIGAANQ